MCDHSVIDEAGTELFTYWKGEEYRSAEIQHVRCQSCQRVFSLDDLHDLG